MTNKKPQLPPKACPICKTFFFPIGVSHQFCSQTCRRTNAYFSNINYHKQKAKEYRLANLEKYKKRQRENYHANAEYYKQQSKQWKRNRRINQPWIPAIESTKQRAKEKKIPFSLTFAWGRARWNGKCELTKIPFVIGLRGNGGKMFSPSIDKINPNKGYTPDNCRFILHCVNNFKYTGTDKQMYAVAKALLKNKK